MGLLLRVTTGPHAGEERRIDQTDELVVGRSSRAAFPMVRDLLLSRDHFRIEKSGRAYHLVDLGSTNGTKVNGLRVERVPLREGDVIIAGQSSFDVVDSGTRNGGPPLANCAACGGRIAPPAPGDSQSGEQTGVLFRDRIAAVDARLCEECRAKRRQFPETDPDYLIEELIGEGGMGEVYRASQLSANRRVAIKMMRANSAADDKAFGYFQREIRVLKDLLTPGGKGHPGIVEFYDLFEVDGHYQLIMEYVDGKNALEWARQYQPLPISTVVQIGRQLLSALSYAHGKGYVHRDVKPSNLLVMGPVHRPRVKLSDFGLAKSFAEGNLFSTMTRQGDVGGSTGFLSPDHIREFRDVKEPADIYSAGATLYYLLTNEYPYYGFNPRQANSYELILESPPIPLRAFRPDAPEELERILQKALQKQPRARWRSAQAMSEALQELLSSTHS
ncbi:FHA domain-containing serine/threonine-protein kinase [Planctomyces sp. SH-PL62]|uniref:FHA domain-containing serine/threonine-protein kinase n=1 Tax=Planctomyces sp. SH-PL62 TaxID=1636152 RepID=UPI00078BCF9A|nr:FHA domain-containing serine/threonine-protein kinase [Planctomyces sp. SH-PL62]AMV38879.1 Serine/threonine-protein kinase PrkC [Planctomyces sp. SH-PL62]